MSRFMCVLAVVSGVASISGAERREAANIAGWGSVSGRVVLDGDPRDPALKPYREDLKVYAPPPILQDPRPAVFKTREGRRIAIDLPPDRRPIAMVRNEKLLVDPKTRGIRNAFVYLLGQPQRVHPSFRDGTELQPVTLTGRDGAFAPRAVTMRVGQKLRLINKDAPNVVHSFRSHFLQNDNFNVMVRTGAYEWTPDHQEHFIPARIVGRYQTAAVAYCLVTEHPYGAITSEDGSFQLKNLPAGEHALRIWHEEVGYVSKRLTVVVKADQIVELPPHKISIARLQEALR